MREVRSKATSDAGAAREDAVRREAEATRAHEAELAAREAQLSDVRATAKREIEEMRLRHEHALQELEERAEKAAEGLEGRLHTAAAAEKVKAANELRGVVEAAAVKESEWAAAAEELRGRLHQQEIASQGCPAPGRDGSFCRRRRSERTV